MGLCEFATALVLIVVGDGPDHFGERQAHQRESVYSSAACTARANSTAHRAAMTEP